MIPGRGQAVFEIILEALLGMTEGAGGKTLGRRMFPLVSALFIFILFANYSGLVAGSRNDRSRTRSCPRGND